MSQSNQNNQIIVEDPPGGITWTLAIISCIVVVWFLLITASIYYLTVGYEREGKIKAIKYEDRINVRQEQENLLTAPKYWNEGVDSISGEEYKKLVVPIDSVFDSIVRSQSKKREE